MSTPTPNTAAASMVARLTGQEPQPKDEDLPEIEEVDEDDTEVESTEEESEETQEEETPEEELPDTVKDILRKNRKIAREKEAENAELKKKIAELENPDAPKEEVAPAPDKFKDLFVKTAAKSALTAAGFSKATDRFVKMIDFDDLDIDDDGNIDGLDEQIEVLKKEFADVIAPKAPVRKTVKTDAAGSREPAPTAKSSASKLSEQLKA